MIAEMKMFLNDHEDDLAHFIINASGMYMQKVGTVPNDGVGLAIASTLIKVALVIARNTELGTEGYTFCEQALKNGNNKLDQMGLERFPALN